MWSNTLQANDTHPYSVHANGLFMCVRILHCDTTKGPFQEPFPLGNILHLFSHSIHIKSVTDGFLFPFVARLNLLHFNCFSTYLTHWRNLLGSVTFPQPLLFLFASLLMSEFISPAFVIFSLFRNEYSTPCDNTCYYSYHYMHAALSIKA